MTDPTILPFDGGEAGNSVPRQRVIAGKTVPRSSIEEHFRMIFAIGAEVLFRARMPSAAACVILGANTRSPRRLIARTA